MRFRPTTACAALFFTAATSFLTAQSDCLGNSVRNSGRVLDSTGAAIVDASVKFAGGISLHTDREGRFFSACLPAGSYRVIVSAAGFETLTQTLNITRETQLQTLRLKPQTVQTEVDAVAGEEGVAREDVAGSRTLLKNDLAQLADDPDEFSRQLQVLAAAAGGAPGQAIVTVDGFQNGGRIPPKSAIAFIRINPDLFSAEYARPPYQGGRVEIFTKPGQTAWHGALFTTQSGEWMNAKDPFSPSRAALGKQRYGFELSGPLAKRRSDFSLALEHRQIDQFAVVNAVTVNADGTMPVVANVPTPLSLWQGSVAVNTVLGPKNILKATYTGTINDLANQGVGGTTLADAGYSSVQSEHAVQFTELATLSATLIHEARIGYTWRYRTDSPNTTGASLQVAGAFTGGGVPTGALRSRERDLEFDDDVLYSRGKHSLKAGLQLLNTSLNDVLPTGFNGTYVFGGGSAPALDGSGTTTVITGLEQYRRALSNLPGGKPTQYNITTGTPDVSLNQLQAVLFAQEQWKLRARLQVSLGLRWAMQNAPVTVGNIGPRLGVAWSPDRKQKTVFHARTGLFFGTIDSSTALTAYRLNGTVQRQLQISNPAYGQPLTTGTSQITTMRAPLGDLTQTPSLQSHLGVEHDFPRHWHAQANLYLVHGWDSLRSRNIDAPQNGSASGPRPLQANTNLYQFQQTGRIGGNVLFLGLDQHSLKRLQIFAGYVRMDLRGNADNDSLFPQSATSDSGEVARPSWEATHQVIAFGNYVLPRAVNLSLQFNSASGQPYNVTTGFDNNGDGVFNDRPVYSAGTGPSAYVTRFGTLTASGNGVAITRNAGTLPWNVHLDANLSRSFTLPHRTGKEAQTVAVNLRSTNLLNHTNGTAAGGVLGSPFFGRVYQADSGRRVEAGLRWSF